MTAKTRKPGKQPIAADADAKKYAESLAAMTFAPEFNAAMVADAFNVGGKPAFGAMIDELIKRGDAVTRGDTKGIERMLASQAYTLDAMFASLARQAKVQESLPVYEAHLKFALRAQNQCRATLETLAKIKNPSNVAFVKQANIAHGPQQVNNGGAAPVARAEQNANWPTELLEAPHERPQWMDAGTPGTASATDPQLATVAAIDRAKDA